MQVQQAGGRGTSTSVFIRGSESDEVLTLIDGVQVNSVTLGAFDFANLTPEGFDRVEVLRGGGGSPTDPGGDRRRRQPDHAARRGSPNGAMSFAGGNGSTDRETGVFSGSERRLPHRRHGDAHRHGGLRHRDPCRRERHRQEDEPGLRRDHRRRAAPTGRPPETGDLYGILHYVGSNVGLANASNYPARSIPTRALKGDFYFMKLGWEDAPIDGLSYRLSGAYVQDDQRYNDPPDPSNSALTRSRIQIGDRAGRRAGELRVAVVAQHGRLPVHARPRDVTSYSSFSEPPVTKYDPTRRDYGVYAQNRCASSRTT